MGRITTLFTIWLGGFFFGFIGYYSYPYISEFILTMVPIIVNIDIQITTAIMVGFTTSIITVALVMFGQIELKIIEYSKNIIMKILKDY